MYADDDDAGPSTSRKRKRTDATTSPRQPKRIETAESSSSTEPDEESATDDDDILNIPAVATVDNDDDDDDDDQPLQYIDMPPTSTTESTPYDSLPQTQSPSPQPSPSQPRRNHTSTTITTTTTPDFLSEYTCPICFSQPTNATLTPCGHICCGSCLFTAVKTTLQRGVVHGPGREPNVARCPVCRAPIPGWDGKGGGVIGLKARVVISL